MIPHPNITFGAGLTEDRMTPVGLAVLLIAAVLVLILPRKWVVVPLLISVFLVPGQQFVIGGVHLFANRIVTLLGCLRFLFKFNSATSPLIGGFTSIDRIFLIWAVCRATAFVILYHVGDAVVNQIGFLWDGLGGYFLLRCLVRNVEDIRRIAKVFVVIAVIVAGCMLYEHYKLTNIFAVILGGKTVPDIREGKIRCRGPFEQQIIASVFGGTLVPLFLWLWSTPKTKIAAVFGLVGCIVITITASSSTGIAAGAVGIGALCLWPFRKYVRQMLWGFVAMIVVLAIVMKAPVWFVLAHVDFVGGSTGWDRANLIDQCVHHFSSWWLVGTADNDTWGYFTWDLCNQFVAEAVQGGLATLILFTVLVARSFRRLGVARTVSSTKTRQWLLWSIGCIMCGHVAGFFGISYFDQIKYWWYLTLAMIPVAALAAEASAAKRTRPASVSRLTSFDFEEESSLVETAVIHSGNPPAVHSIF